MTQPTRDRPTDFSQRVRSNFPRWDSDNDGRIHRSDIERLMLDASIRGRNAAAVAALNTRMELLGEHNAITLNDVTIHEHLYAKGDPNSRRIEDAYLRGQDNINRTSRELFPQNDIRLESITEGLTTEEYCRDAIDASLAHEPRALHRMIQENPNGTYNVTLAGGGPITINAPSDAEIARYADAGSNGLWLTVLEKACDEDRNDRAWFSLHPLPCDRPH